MLGQFLDPVRTWVDARDATVKCEQQRYQLLRNMTCSENSDWPTFVSDALEQQLNFAAASHADIGLQVPLDQFTSLLVVVLRQKLLSMADRFRFDLATTNRTSFDTPLSDDCLGPDDLRRAAADGDQCDCGKAGLAVIQLRHLAGELKEIEIHAMFCSSGFSLARVCRSVVDCKARKKSWADFLD